MTEAIEVGLQNSELKNSPIASELEEDAEATWVAVDETPACYFNDAVYPDRTIVKSGDTYLECQHGVWVPIASSDPDNP